jgi:hypothetical protein
VRVQPLENPISVRIENARPKDSRSAKPSRGGAARREAGRRGKARRRETVVATASYRVVVPDGAAGLAGVRVENAAGATLCVLSNALLAKKDLPAPSALPAVWVLGDAPRVVPPAWGALPPPEGAENATSG